MSGNWRIYRPAIWMAMIGLALILLVAPAYFGVLVIGAAIGMGARIESGRRRGRSRPAPGRSPRSRGRNR